MGTQSSLWRPGACNMLALGVVSLLVGANGSRLPASSEQVMPKLHLAYLVEDVEYPRPEGLQASNEELPHSSRVKRQESSSQAVNSQLEAREEAERLETEEADAETFSTASATSGRNAALSAAIGKVVQASVVAPSAHAKLEHGKRRKRSENFDNFVPFSVYDDRRVKLLKVEENDFHALPRVIASNKQKRADLEKVEEAKVHVVQLTADQ